VQKRRRLNPEEVKQPVASDTPRTAAIKEDIADVPELSLIGQPADDYRTIRARDAARRQDGKPAWHDPSMQRAAGIDSSLATRIRREERPAPPGTPRTAVFKTDIADVPELSLIGQPADDNRTIRGPRRGTPAGR
jgi:hypothetical protein